jgi:uncharacterized protein (DUF2062 family)
MNAPAPGTPAPGAPASGLRGFWRRRVVDLLLAQLRQGITPQKIALTLALGTVIALFPIMGTTTALCVLVGVALQLNQPIIQLVNWIAWPLQISGIYFFVRAGEWITRSPPVSFSISALLVAFKHSPVRFLQQYGMTGLRGVLAWALIAPGVAALIYVLTLPLIKRMRIRLTALAQRT